MENGKLDIEKTKELFEYEMTEVLLKLQGEFSKISGLVEEECLSTISEEASLKTPLKVALPEPPAVSLNVPKESLMVKEVSPIDFHPEHELRERIIFDIPSVPVVEPMTVSEIEIEPTILKMDWEVYPIAFDYSKIKPAEIDFHPAPLMEEIPTVKQFAVSKLPEVNMEQASAPKVELEYDASQIQSLFDTVSIDVKLKQMELDTSKCKKVSIPSIPENNGMTEISTSLPETTIPKVNGDMFELPIQDKKSIDVSIPITIVPTPWNAHELKLEELPSFDKKLLSFVAENGISEFKQPEIKDYEPSKPEIQIPKTSIGNPGSFAGKEMKIALEKKQVSMPKTPDFQSFKDDFYETLQLKHE